VTFKKRRSKKGSYRAAGALAERIRVAEALVRDGFYTEARVTLEEILERSPKHPAALRALVLVATATEDVTLASRAVEPLYDLEPDDPQIALLAATARLAYMRPALALDAFRRFVALAPEGDPQRELARETIEMLEREVPERAAQLGLVDEADNRDAGDAGGSAAGDDALEFLTAHERITVLLEARETRELRRAVDDLLALRPRFVPALNNLSLACMVEGRLDEAIDVARRVLAIDEENFHALSNLVRFHVLSGRREEALEEAERLLATSSEDATIWAKKLEAFTFLGDDARVLAVFREAEAAGVTASEAADPLLFHLAAVAAYRTGREADARGWWAEALRRDPSLDLADENLADLDAPPGERHAPWPFGLATFVSRELALEMARRTKGNRDLGASLRRFLADHPEVADLVPFLLERGDPAGRHLAFTIATAAETPEMLAALASFTTDRWGPISMRTQAAEAAMRAGLIPRGTVRMWDGAEWRDVRIMGCEVTGEPVVEYPPKIRRWLEEGGAATRRGAYGRARELFGRVLEAVPGDPGARYNLAIVDQFEGREEEAMAVVREIAAEHPDYLFAATSLARAAIEDEKLDEAEALLEPFYDRARFHVSEFAAFCDVLIRLALAREQYDAAESWLATWESAIPEHPGVERWRAIL
jgi:tetratricopeptide (TPR) repeat protein